MLPLQPARHTASVHVPKDRRTTRPKYRAKYPLSQLQPVSTTGWPAAAQQRGSPSTLERCAPEAECLSAVHSKQDATHQQWHTHRVIRLLICAGAAEFCVLAALMQCVACLEQELQTTSCAVTAPCGTSFAAESSSQTATREVKYAAYQIR